MLPSLIDNRHCFALTIELTIPLVEALGTAGSSEPALRPLAAAADCLLRFLDGAGSRFLSLLCGLLSLSDCTLGLLRDAAGLALGSLLSLLEEGLGLDSLCRLAAGGDAALQGSAQKLAAQNVRHPDRQQSDPPFTNKGSVSGWRWDQNPILKGRV